MPVTSRKQRVFGLERDVEGKGKQCGVDRPRTVDRHLCTHTSLRFSDYQLSGKYVFG